MENYTAKLESQLDFYETELANLQYLLQKCGFPEGITTLKEAAHELLSLQDASSSDQ